jgi:hypothetical protein
MTDQLKQQWAGTDDESRIETYRGGAAYWLATPWPRPELWFAGALAIGAVASVPLLWNGDPAAALVLGALMLAFAGYATAASVWTLRHPQQAGHHLAAASHYNNVKWRKHPLSLAIGIVIFGFVNGAVRFHDHGTGGRLVAGAASAGFAAILSAIAVWHARRKAHDDHG